MFVLGRANFHKYHRNIEFSYVLETSNFEFLIHIFLNKSNNIMSLFVLLCTIVLVLHGQSLCRQMLRQKTMYVLFKHFKWSTGFSIHKIDEH